MLSAFFLQTIQNFTPVLGVFFSILERSEVYEKVVRLSVFGLLFLRLKGELFCIKGLTIGGRASYFSLTEPMFMPKSSSKTIKVNGVEVNIHLGDKDDDYINITDMAKSKNKDEPKDVISNWMRLRNTIEFLGLWEKLHNPNFKGVEFEAFKNESGSNTFTLSATKWVGSTNSIGIKVKSGRYGGGTFAHKDIAFEFGSWLSPEFKLYLIKEFQRLKQEESDRKALGWDLHRALAKTNYKVQTSAIAAKLTPSYLTKEETCMVYADEAEMLNKVLFGHTSREWRTKHPKEHKEGLNMRDLATTTQLIVLSNLESLNAELIHQNLSQAERMSKLSAIAMYQTQLISKDYKTLGKMELLKGRGSESTGEKQ